MDNLELTTFKNIFNKLSYENKDAFIKEIKKYVFQEFVNEASQTEVIQSFKDDIKDSILSLLKNDNTIIKHIVVAATKEIVKFAIIYKLVDEITKSKNYKMRPFNLKDDKNIYVCISKEECDYEEAIWLKEWSFYSINELSSLNIPLDNWKYFEGGGKQLVREMLLEMGVNL